MAYRDEMGAFAAATCTRCGQMIVSTGTQKSLHESMHDTIEAGDNATPPRCGLVMLTGKTTAGILSATDVRARSCTLEAGHAGQHWDMSYSRPAYWSA